MSGIIEMDVSNCKLYERYEKLNGYFWCKICSLNTFNKMYLMEDYINENDIKKHIEINNKLLMCRSDAPFGYRLNLLRGRDLYLHQLNQFLAELRKKVKEAVIIFSPYDEIGIAQNRYNNTEGATVFVEWERGITIEYVSRGFDVGNMTQGKGIHWHLFYKWEDVNILKRYEKAVDDTKVIDIMEYRRQREKRINSLMCNSNYSRCDIERLIPLEPGKPSKYAIDMIYKDVICKVIKNRDLFDSDVIILSNIYNDRIYSFEIMRA